MTLLTDAYLAGFFDGEGCIGIYQNGNRTFHLRLQLVQNESRLVTSMFEGLQARFGGNFRGHYSPNGRSKYNLQLNGDNALRFLEALCPHLVLKRAQAEIAIAWYKARPPVSRDAKGRIQAHAHVQRVFDEKVAELLRILKRRNFTEVLLDRPELVAAAGSLGIREADLR